MKSVLIAIQPYWVFLIIAKAMGWNYPQEKTIEVRKTFPKSEEWNEIVEIYCSKDKKSFNRIPKEYQPLMEKFLGKVVGDFVCDTFITDRTFGHDVFFNAASCMSDTDIASYCTNKEMFGWHISDLVVYDKPKELCEFKAFCNSYYDGKKCDGCKYFIDGDCYEYDESDCGCNGFKLLERPPQSWCYIEA